MRLPRASGVTPFSASQEFPRCLRKPYDANGTNVYYIKRQLEQDLLPGTGTYFAHLDANIKRGEYRVAWNIIASDGSKFLETARYSYFTIDVV
jgi:methionine-rich copper-binding protein CopC